MCIRDSHKALAALSEQYGSNLIAVGIHAGSFAIGEDETNKYFPVGLKQPEGEEYANKWGDLDALGYPCAVFDRRGSAALLTSGTWDTNIYEEIQRPTNLDIDLAARVNAANEIEISTELKPYADMKGKLQLWVVEDGIVASQIDHGSLKKNYVQNHVFRAAVNEMCIRDRPCPMCLGAIYWAHLDKIYYANDRKDAAAIGFDDDFIYQELELKNEDRHKKMELLLPEEAKKAFEMWAESTDKTEY